VILSTTHGLVSVRASGFYWDYGCRSSVESGFENWDSVAYNNWEEKVRTTIDAGHGGTSPATCNASFTVSSITYTVA